METLGSDHFITLPILGVYTKKYGCLSVIQFDAHSVLWADDDIGRIDQGTFMYKAVKLGLVYVKRSVQIGNRTDCNDCPGYIDARAVQEKRTTCVIEKVKQIDSRQ